MKIILFVLTGYIYTYVIFNLFFVIIPIPCCFKIYKHADLLMIAISIALGTVFNSIRKRKNIFDHLLFIFIVFVCFIEYFIIILIPQEIYIR